jgi:hypothetical protein
LPPSAPCCRHVSTRELARDAVEIGSSELARFLSETLRGAAHLIQGTPLALEFWVGLALSGNDDRYCAISSYAAS